MSTLVGLVGAAGAGTTIVFVVLWAIEYRKRGRLALDLERAEAEVTAAKEQHDSWRSVAVNYRKEIRELETMLSDCSDPATIRDRIRKLLSQ